MSQHPSLKVDSVGLKHRNVLNRLERVKKMKQDEKWTDDRSIYNLPKIKSIKIKVKSSSKGPKQDEEQGKDGKAAS